MASLLTALKRLLLLGLLLAFPLMAWTQNFSPQGGEYSLAPLSGDQIWPRVSVNASGGYVVWEDTAMDGKGHGIGALRLDNNFGAPYAPFRVNQLTTGFQERPQVALLNKGGAAIVWQGRSQKFSSIYARFLNAVGTFTGTNDIRVNSTTNTDQVEPALTVMTNGNVFVVWSSWNYSISNLYLQDIRGQILTTNGTLVGTNFYINGTNSAAPSQAYNQRNPVAATLANGNILVAWVSENQGVPGLHYVQGTNWIHIFARLYSPAGAPLGPEFRVNDALYSFCANPAIAPNPDGGFTVVWSQRLTVRTPESWDIFGRRFSASGGTVGEALRINSHTYGDQFGPGISAVGDSQLVVWTSLGQDGSREGVFGQLLFGGALSGAEFQVNTTTISRQIHPTLASDAAGRFLVVWSSYTRNTAFDLYAQRYAGGQSLPRPAAPFVSPYLRIAESGNPYSLGVAWPAILGYPLSYYEIYQDSSPTPTATTTNNLWLATDLAPGSTHWFQIAFVVAGGARSPLSAATTNKTWGFDFSGKAGTPDGLPDDWQSRYFGSKTSDWDGPNVDSDGDGATNWQEFLAGTNPRDPSDVLKSWLNVSQQGRRFFWNTRMGCVYQVQASSDLTTWWASGSPRFATGGTDSILLPAGQSGTYYRVLRLQ